MIFEPDPNPEEFTYVVAFNSKSKAFVATVAEIPEIKVTESSQIKALNSAKRFVVDYLLKTDNHSFLERCLYPEEGEGLYTAVFYGEEWEDRCGRSCSCYLDSQHSDFVTSYFKTFTEAVIFLRDKIKNSKHRYNQCMIFTGSQGEIPSQFLRVIEGNNNNA